MKKIFGIFIRYCCMAAVLIYSTTSFATDDFRQTCRTVTVEETLFYGTILCRIGPYENSIDVPLRDATTERSRTIAVTDFSAAGRIVGACVDVPLPHSYTTTRNSRVCDDIPFEPYISRPHYEPSYCYGARMGEISWPPLDADKIQMQRKTNGEWRTIFEDTQRPVQILIDGGSRAELRIRGFKEGEPLSQNGYGTWNYFSPYAPTCDGGPLD